MKIVATKIENDTYILMNFETFEDVYQAVKARPDFNSEMEARLDAVSFAENNNRLEGLVTPAHELPLDYSYIIGEISRQEWQKAQDQLIENYLASWGVKNKNRE